MARVVAVTLGLDTVPGTTITRYCSSSVQTTRMAMHAIRAGEGHVFISAGVEAVSRAARGTADNPPVDPTADPRSRAGNPWTNIIYERAQGESAARAAGGTGVWHDPRQDGELPDVYVAMGQTAENVAGLRSVSQGRAGRVRLPFPESRRSRCGGRLLEAGDHAADHVRRHGGRCRRLPARRHHDRRTGRSEAGLPAGRHDHGRKRLPAERRCRRAGDHERHQGRRAGHHPAGPGHRHRCVGALAGDHGPRTRSRPAARRSPWPA